MASGPGRYPLLLTFGASYSVGAQLASVSVVLTFLLAEKGILWAAGLLYPAFSIGFVAGNALSPLVVERSRRHQNVVIAAAAAVIAVLTSCTAVSGLHDLLVAPVFVVASSAIGLRDGIGEQRLRRDHFKHAGQESAQSPAAQPGGGRRGADRGHDVADPSARGRTRPTRGRPTCWSSSASPATWRR